MTEQTDKPRPLYQWSDDELESLVNGSLTHPEGARARNAAITILINRQQQRTNPAAFRGSA